MTNKILKSIGLFCVEFEQVFFKLEACIRQILFDEGLKNDNIQEILLSNLSAFQILQTTQSLYFEKYAPAGKNKKIADKIFKDIQGLIENRNNIIHSKWFIAREVSNKRKEIAFGHKLHKKKEGNFLKKFEYTEKDFNEQNEKTVKNRNIISTLYKTIILKSDLIEWFDLDSEGNIKIIKKTTTIENIKNN